MAELYIVSSLGDCKSADELIWPIGTVVALTVDDGSDCPYYTPVGGGDEEPEWRACMSPYKSEPTAERLKGGTVMSNIVKKIKDLALSKDDRLLREQGITDECGQLTEEGRQVLEQVVFAAHKGAVVTLVQNVADAEKAEKKKK